MNSHRFKTPMISLCPALLGVLLSTSAASAQFAFDASVEYAVGTQPSGMAAGDFDNDGDFDLATSVDNPDRLIILTNDGTGSFVLGQTVNLPASSSPGDVVAGDLDGDGDVDVAVALKDFGTIIAVINNGGTFTLGSQAVVGDEPRGMDIADMDGDGDLDIVVANRDSNTATVLDNGGSATFSSVTLTVGNDPRAATFGDFDGDDDQDVAVTNHDDRTISIFTNTKGGFVFAGTLSVGGQVRPEGIAGVDLDNDGDDDIAAATNGQNGTINNATIFLSNGGSFSGPFHYSTGGQDTSNIIAADLDCDRLADLTTSNKSSNNLSILPNLGGGVFGAATIVGVGTSPEELAAADLDCDGDADVAVANRDSDDVSVSINQTCEPCLLPGDLNSDGSVNGKDIQEFVDCVLNGDCASNSCGDMNCDGVVDFSDGPIFVSLLLGQ